MLRSPVVISASSFNSVPSVFVPLGLLMRNTPFEVILPSVTGLTTRFSVRLIVFSRSSRLILSGYDSAEFVVFFWSEPEPDTGLSSGAMISKSTKENSAEINFFFPRCV